MGVTNLLVFVQNHYFSVKQFSKSCFWVWNDSKHVFHIMFVMIQQDYFQKNVFIVPNIYKWGHCRRPNEVTRGQPQNLNGVSQLALGLIFGNSEDVITKNGIKPPTYVIWIYIYGSSINHNLWFYLDIVSECKAITGNSNGNSNGENPWEKKCNDISLNLELSRVILGVHLKSFKWVSWNKQYVILFIYSYIHIICGIFGICIFLPLPSLGIHAQWDGHDLAPVVVPGHHCEATHSQVWWAVSSWSSQIWDGHLIPVIHTDTTWYLGWPWQPVWCGFFSWIFLTLLAMQFSTTPGHAGTSRTVQTDLTEDGHGLQLRRGRRTKALCDLTFREI